MYSLAAFAWPGDSGVAQDGARSAASVTQVARVGTALAAVGESPLWHAKSLAIYWVDIPSGRILRTRPDGSTDILNVGEPVGSIACTTGTELIAAMKSGVFSLSFDTTRPTLIGAPPGHPPTHRFNDATTDTRGNLIVGTMSLAAPGEPSGRLYRLTPGGEWRLLLEGLRTINGLAVSADGGTLYVSDSHPDERSVWICKYDPDEGAVRRRELFARFGAELGRPDGAAMDAADHYWIAGNDAWAVHRFAPGGALVQSIAMPVQKPSKPAFGGPDLRTLYVTSIASGILDPALQPDAGALFRVAAGLAGLPLTPFGG
jgi:L-arabinonolactonase